MKKSRSFLALVLCLCLFFECVVSNFEPCHVYAAESFESKKNEILTSAIQYLKSSQNEDGSFGDTYLINDTAEAAAVLRRFSDVDVSRSLTWLKDHNEESNIDVMSRIIMTEGNTDDVKNLLKAWNQDGGIGLSEEYGSDILDSILALEAINSLDNTFHNNTTWKMVTYIARQKNKDGSFSYTKNSNPNNILTAMALYAVSKYMSDNKITSDLTADMISKSTAYLKKRFDNTFPEETIEENLYIALALLENNSLDDIEEVVNNLSKIQKDNGSFCDDVHLTSLAVWLLGKMDIDHMVLINDLQISNTSTAYYEKDTKIDVSYAVSYKSQIEKEYTIRCTVVNGNRLLKEVKDIPVTLSPKKNMITGNIEDIVINENRDDGILVTVQLLDGENVVKETTGTVKMINPAVVGETEIADINLTLSEYFAYVGEEKEIRISYDMLYNTNVDNDVDISIEVVQGQNVVTSYASNVKLIPGKDSAGDNSLSFIPDTSKEGEYNVILKCTSDGEEIAELSAIFRVVGIPEEIGGDIKSIQDIDVHSPGDAHTPGDADKQEDKEPYLDLMWAAPILSEYAVWGNKDEVIDVSYGISYISNYDVDGKIVVTATKDGEVIGEVTENITLSKDSKYLGSDKVMSFTEDGKGRYVVKTVLYDSEGKVLIKGEKELKILYKKQIPLVMNVDSADGANNVSEFSWNDITGEDNRYYYQFYRKKRNEEWETRSTWNGEVVKVLNIYPPAGNNLYGWMNNTIGNTNETASKGVLDISRVDFGSFNHDPDAYLLDENGNYIYDVLMIGSSDCNGGYDLSLDAYNAMRGFLNSGRGVLFGHDSVVDNTAQTHYYLARLGEEYLGFSYFNSNGGGDGYYVNVVNHGVLTSFPWKLTGTMYIPYSHTSGQYVPENSGSTIWMEYSGYNNKDNFYLITKGSCAMIQTGHSGWATDDERRILANTLFYLKRMTDATTATDNDFYDIEKPVVKDITVKEVNDDSIEMILNAEDFGTDYQYYVSAIPYSGIDNELIKSNVENLTSISGIMGYVYTVSDSTEPMDIVEYDENHEHVINTNNADSDGKLSISIEAPELDKKQYLHVYAIDNADNVSEEKIIPLDEGMLTTSISTDKKEYLSDETVVVKAETKSLLYTEDGDVSISLYNSEDSFVEEVYYENGQSVYKDEPYSINTDIVLDETYEGEYSLKIEWENEEKVLCSDKVTFKVKKVEDEIIEEIVNPASPTDPVPSNPASPTDSNPSETKTDPAKDEPVKDPSKEPTNNNPNKDNNPDEKLRDNEGRSSAKPKEELTTEVTTESDTTESKKEEINETTTETHKQGTNRTDNNAPTTGDSFRLILILMCMIVSAGVIVYIVWRKNK
ncbi:MAG: hypothetical protein J6O17_07705, partial [Eubacterium sp.]|nr:hypothetical protein [Eubacterium sp.]